MQPLKIFCMALFIALIVKKLEDEEKSEVEKAARHLAKDENWLTTSAHDTTIFDRVEVTEMKPPDLSKLDWMRELRIKETQMYAITREITLYIFHNCSVFRRIPNTRHHCVPPDTWYWGAVVSETASREEYIGQERLSKGKILHSFVMYLCYIRMSMVVSRNMRMPMIVSRNIDNCEMSRQRLKTCPLNHIWGSW